MSYESAQLANPDFFSPQNHKLIALFRELSRSGNLRIGGGSSEFTTFSAENPSAPPPFEAFGPDTSKTVKTGTITTALALHQLRGFLDATGWSCLYGLNLGRGTAENAASEAAAAQRILGSRLLAFQIGNEPDSFRNRYRPATYTPADYLAEWNHFRDRVAHAAPGARFAGPDISNKLSYLTAFAQEAPHHPDVVLLTSHYYAMGPAGSPHATLDNLLSEDPVSSTLKNRDLSVIEDARRLAHLPYRMSEGNSCWNGGQPGISDGYASALWSAGYILRCMQRGWAGVNLHGGGNGIYSPIVGAPSRGFTRRPEFFGIRFVARFAGASMIPTRLAGTEANVEAFTFAHPKEHELVIVNSTAHETQLSLPAGIAAAKRSVLHAPSLAAKDGIEISETHDAYKSSVTASPYTANTYALRGLALKKA
ncbi:hypothetical protein [Silvibacterium dinghuense]|uniref:Beta-glucuronidase C-terminal domain-containing protein n=1 Tax=Silvibacterium dinghuense TaxID=1560006 RepID=A0A4Q1SCH2_9BACT|nr:hypothetical protein [Silvibacterium dinghuense]RXS94932.1 hypothetical protein ESZ00_09845 [Silvibacterium dinghuense]